jgi:N-acetylmuramoyl-L-alanine amidase
MSAISGKLCTIAIASGLIALTWDFDVSAQKKIFLNPSNQTWNPVSGGGNEAQYALINAKLTKAILLDAGFSVTLDQDFKNSPKNANSWGAHIFVSFHSNAGGGHGPETLYLSTAGKALADKVQKGIVAKLPYASRGLKKRTDLHVLNATNMPACLNEAVFHDCSKTSGYIGHPPSESSFLKSSSGQKKISQGIANGICSYYGKTCSGTTPTKGWLKGLVYRAPNMKDPIVGAKVTLNTGASMLTSSTGYWAFQLQAGSYKVTASASGYTTKSVTATVSANQDKWSSIGLSKKSTPPVTPDQSVTLQDSSVTVHDSSVILPDGGTDSAATIDDLAITNNDSKTPPLWGDISNNENHGGEGCSYVSFPASTPPLGIAVLSLLLFLGLLRRKSVT